MTLAKKRDSQSENMIAHFLHISKQSPTSQDIVQSIRKGLPFKTIKEMSDELKMPIKELSETIGLNQRTFARRKLANKLNSGESDRLYRLINIYYLANKILKNKEYAIQWLKTPKTALGGEIPKNLLDTEVGAREVENLLGRIEYGVYS